MTQELLYKDLSYNLQGALFEVRKALGPGYKESIYRKALESEFKKRDINFEVEKQIDIFYKKEKAGTYRPDFIIENKILLEIKAVSELPDVVETQLYYYLKASEYKIGYLVNFGSKDLDIRRRIYTK